MTGRRVRAALHWAAVTAVAFLLAETAPFTGWHATATTAVIAAGVGLIGLATTPPRKGAQR